MASPEALKGGLGIPLIGAPMFIATDEARAVPDYKQMIVDSAADDSAKAWKDIWGAGQGVGNIHDILPARELVLRMEREYRETLERLAAS